MMKFILILVAFLSQAAMAIRYETVETVEERERAWEIKRAIEKAKDTTLKPYFYQGSAGISYLFVKAHEFEGYKAMYFKAPQLDISFDYGGTKNQKQDWYIGLSFLFAPGTWEYRDLDYPDISANNFELNIHLGVQRYLVENDAMKQGFLWGGEFGYTFLYKSGRNSNDKMYNFTIKLGESWPISRRMSLAAVAKGTLKISNLEFSGGGYDDYKDGVLKNQFGYSVGAQVILTRR